MSIDKHAQESDTTSIQILISKQINVPPHPSACSTALQSAQLLVLLLGIVRCLGALVRRVHQAVGCAAVLVAWAVDCVGRQVAVHVVENGGEGGVAEAGVGGGHGDCVVGGRGGKESGGLELGVEEDWRR
jgi:hypothetical protein